GLVREIVAVERVPELDLAGPGEREALRGRPLGLHLRHGKGKLRKLATSATRLESPRFITKPLSERNTRRPAGEGQRGRTRRIRRPDLPRASSATAAQGARSIRKSSRRPSRRCASRTHSTSRPMNPERTATPR